MPFLAAIPAALGASTAATGLAGGLASGILTAASQTPGTRQTPGQQIQLGALQDYSNLIGQGPGGQEIGQNLGAQQDLAAELDRLRREGLGPTQQDIQQQQGLASQLFQARRTQQEQDFFRQQQQFAQDAARMGRSPLDPVFRNKLAEQQLMAQERLGAEQNVLGTQLAQQAPMQRLSLQQGRANILQGLASQALSNRQALAGLGQQAAGIAPEGQGGGLLGALEGFTAGFGKGLPASQQLQRLFR